jgi:hypothetical protein
MRLTAIVLEWGGEEHTFDLKLGQVRALQEKTGFGPALLAHRLQSGQWYVDDFRETLKQGLICGEGKSPNEAEKLVKQFCDERPARESILPATAILLSWINGAPPPKKAKAPKTEERMTEAAASTSAHSMEPAQPSDLAPAK